MRKSNLTPRELVGQSVAQCRRDLSLNQAELARCALVSQSVISESETGARLAPWSVVDALCDELEEHDQAVKAAGLRNLRSRVEAPGLGEPGTVALCLSGDSLIEDWHWVRRKPGQIYCDVHGEPQLIGSCPVCDFEFWRTGDRGTACPGCAIPMGALAEQTKIDPGGEIHMAIERQWREAADALLELGIAPIVAAPTPMSEKERICGHNVRLGKTLDTLGQREGKHYMAARALAECGRGTFSRSDLIEEYQRQDPSTDPSHVLPSDFRIGVERRGRSNAWFLSKPGRNRYQFVGLDGEGDSVFQIATA